MSVRKILLAWLLVSTATLGCNQILGNIPVVLDEDDDNPGDGGIGIDGRVPDTSVGGPSSDGAAGDNRPTDGGLSDREGGSNPPLPDAPPPEGGAGTPDRDGGSNPPPDVTTPPPDTPRPDVTTPPPDTTTPPTDGRIDTSMPPPGDGGPTCTAPLILCGGQCVSPTDPKTCGSCTHDCTTLPQVSGTTTCQAGTCVVPPGSCATGWAHCSTNGDDGCEVDISKPEHCGSCTNVCMAPTPLCANSADAGASSFQCKSTCMAPSPDLCGMSCVDIKSDPLHCSRCSNPCPPPTARGQAVCNSSVCGVSCDSSFPDYCSAANTCVNLNADIANCGTCGNPCPPPTANGQAVCNNRVCGVTCNSSFPDYCSANNTCVNLDTDIANCGVCGTPCVAPANGTVTGCASGVCQTACNAGYDKVGTACVQLRFYINHDVGNDANVGTEALPFKTWKRAATRAVAATNPQIFFVTGSYYSTDAGEDYTTKIPDGATVATSGGKVFIEGNGVAGFPFAGSGTFNGGTGSDGFTLTGFNGPLSTTTGTQTLSSVTLLDMRQPVYILSVMSITNFAMESITGIGQFWVNGGSLSISNGTLKGLVGACFNESQGRSSVSNTASFTANNVQSDGVIQLTSSGTANLTNVRLYSTCGGTNSPGLEVSGATQVTLTSCTLPSNVQINGNTSFTARGSTFEQMVTFNQSGTYDLGTTGSPGGNTFIAPIYLVGLGVHVNAVGNRWFPSELPADATGNVNPASISSYGLSHPVSGPQGSSNLIIDDPSSSVTYY